VSTRALGVDDTLRDSLTVEVGKKVDQVEVLEQEGTVLTHTLGLVGVGNGNTIAGSVDSVW